MLGDTFDDFVISAKKIIAAHSGFPRDSGRNHHDIGIRRIPVIVCSGQPEVVTFNGAGLHQIKSLPLRHSLNNIDENNIRELLLYYSLATSGAHIAGAHDSNFPSSHYVFSH